MIRTIDTILGRAFAHASAEQQAEVLNAAGSFVARTFGSDGEHRMRSDREMQCCQIADHLTEDGWTLLRCLMQFDPKAKP